MNTEDKLTRREQVMFSIVIICGALGILASFSWGGL